MPVQLQVDVTAGEQLVREPVAHRLPHRRAGRVLRVAETQLDPPAVVDRRVGVGRGHIDLEGRTGRGDERGVVRARDRRRQLHREQLRLDCVELRSGRPREGEHPPSRHALHLEGVLVGSLGRRQHRRRRSLPHRIHRDHRVSGVLAGLEVHLILEIDDSVRAELGDRENGIYDLSLVVNDVVERSLLTLTSGPGEELHPVLRLLIDGGHEQWRGRGLRRHLVDPDVRSPLLELIIDERGEVDGIDARLVEVDLIHRPHVLRQRFRLRVWLGVILPGLQPGDAYPVLVVRKVLP